MTEAERFWVKVTGADVAECWLWVGAKNPQGYGRFTAMAEGRNRTVAAHRWSYQYMRAEIIPYNLCLDHLCSNPPCVNPWHLEPVTWGVNSRRSSQRGRAHGAYMNPSEAPANHKNTSPMYMRVVADLRSRHAEGTLDFEVTPQQIARRTNLTMSSAEAAASWLAAEGIADSCWLRSSKPREAVGVVREVPHIPSPRGLIRLEGDPGVTLALPDGQLLWASTEEYDYRDRAEFEAEIAELAAAKAGMPLREA